MGCEDSVLNFLKPNGFKFTLTEIPKAAYTCQMANVPGLALGSLEQATPFLDLNRIGDKVVFEDLTLEFIIAEDMSNYIEIYDWIIAMGFPDNYNQFSDYDVFKSSIFPLDKRDDESKFYSDGTLTVLNSNNNPIVYIDYKDLFPVALTSIPFDTKIVAVEYLTATVTFKYHGYRIRGKYIY